MPSLELFTPTIASLDPRNCGPAELFRRTKDLGIGERATRRWLGSVMGRGEVSAARWFTDGILPHSLKAITGDLQQLALVESRISPTDGFQKLLFRTVDGLPLETVIIPLHAEGAVTVCLSSQVGCVMGCTFCATAKMSQRRNLQTWEIVDQFLQARAIAATSGRRVTGAVFMGMGEPFLNYARVMAAAELLCFPVLNAISGKAITVSTVGLVDEIDRFTEEERPFRLSISIGAASDAKRAKLVPVAARTPIARVMESARRYSLSRKTRVNIAYVCVAGENVSEDDAIELGRVVGDTQVRIDLIPVTDTSGRYQAPTESDLALFRDALTRYVGQPVIRRYSGGADIRAACGTLAGSLE